MVIAGGGVRFRVHGTSGSARPSRRPPPAPKLLASAATALPAVVGVAESGQVLTAAAGPWTGSPPFEYAYAWQRCTADGTSCSALAGARAPT